MNFNKILLALLCLLLLASTVLNAKPAAGTDAKEIAIQKAHILRAINSTRANQNQKPITFRKLSTAARLSKTHPVTDSGGAITGQLHTEDGTFHHFGFVTAWTADSTDNSGVAVATLYGQSGYRIDNLNPGDYYVLAISEGFVPKFYNNVFNFHEATLVSVEDGEEVRGIDFEMVRVIPGTGSISGSVSGEVTDNTIPGAVINVWAPANPFQYGTARSDDDGNFAVTGLKSGAYYAAASAEGYLLEYYSNAETLSDATLITVNEPNETTGIGFTLSEGGKISGRVTDEDGDGVTNAFVEAAPPFWYGQPDSTVYDSLFIVTSGFAGTDDDGYYTIAGLQTGEYYVSVRAGNQFFRVFEWYDNAHTIADATPVPVQLGEETHGINFELALEVYDGEIFGTVTDADGSPLFGASISLFRSHIDPLEQVSPLPSATTDRNGEYTIKNIPHGEYFVLASYNNQWQWIQRWWPDSETREGAEAVVLDKNSPAQQVDFELPIAIGTGSISGRVQNTSGEPLAHAFIEIIETPNAAGEVQVWAYATSDSGGSYRVDNLPEGKYEAGARYWQDDHFGQQWYDHQDAAENADQISLADGDSAANIDFDLEVKPFYGEISGTVFEDETGDVIDRAYVEITPSDFYLYTNLAPFTRWPFYAITDDNGEYKLDWLPQGDYTISVYTNGAVEYFEDVTNPDEATPVTVVGGDTLTVDFGVTRKEDGPGVISGEVYDEYNDGFLEIALVKAMPLHSDLSDANPEAIYTAVTNRSGHYKITGLPDGEYLVFAWSPFHVGEYYDSVFDPAEALPVKVDSLNPATGIDFSLHPVLYATRGLIDSEGPTLRATVFGKVTDEQGNPLHDAAVYLLNEEKTPVSFGRTNGTGHYEMGNVANGVYRIQVSRAGYKTKFNGGADSFEAAENIEITNGGYEHNISLAAGSVTSVGNSGSTIPETIQLHENFPNPFNPSTQISFGLPTRTQVNISVFNLIGQKVRELVNREMAAGTHFVIWNGQTETGQIAPSGIYFYALQTGERQLMVRKMTLLK